MNNKIYTVFRILLALIFIPSAFISFFIQPAQMGLSPEATEVISNLWATGYIMHLVKIIELLVGLMFLTNRYVKLACVLIAPIMINILLLAVFKDARGLISSIPMLCMILYIAKNDWDYYKKLFV
ncbi:MAG: DoxX family membrane protein [Leptospiraceae bacterium]|nr:DoxX family membrane protein [Leptospiraceae bacterium]